MKFKQQNNKNNLKINPKNNKNIPLELLVEILKASINPIDVQRQLTRKHLENKLGINSKITANMCKMKLFGIYWRKHIKTMLTTSKIIYQFIGYKYLKRESKQCFIAININNIQLVIKQFHYLSKIYNIQDRLYFIKLLINLDGVELYLGQFSNSGTLGIDGGTSATGQSDITGDEIVSQKKEGLSNKSLLDYPASGICHICNNVFKKGSWNQHFQNKHKEFVHLDNTFFVSEYNVRAYIEKKLTDLGFDLDHIVQLADLIVFADKYGYYSKGMSNFQNYVLGVTEGIIDIAGKPNVTKRNNGVAHVNSNKSLGVVSGNFCVELAVDMARKFGIGIVTTNSTNILGPKQFYLKKMAQYGFSGFVYVNNSSLGIIKNNKIYVVPNHKITDQLQITLSLFTEGFTQEDFRMEQCFLVKGPCFTGQNAFSEEVEKEYVFSIERDNAYERLFTTLKGRFRYSQEMLSDMPELGNLDLCMPDSVLFLSKKQGTTKGYLLLYN